MCKFIVTHAAVVAAMALFICDPSRVGAFVPAVSNDRHHHGTSQGGSIDMVVDPTMIGAGAEVIGDLGIADIGIAAVSAAAGVMSQLPRLGQLEKQVDEARGSLDSSKKEMEDKIEELEGKLFVMDRDYEQATEKFQKQYDRKMRDEIEQITNKLKLDYQYNLEIKLEREKGKLLEEKLDMVNDLTGKKQAQMMELQQVQRSLQEANDSLQRSLADTEAELGKLREEAVSTDRGFWNFFKRAENLAMQKSGAPDEAKSEASKK